MDYLELKVTLTPRDPWAEILSAQLVEVGFESFVEFENGVICYAPVSDATVDSAVQNSFLSDLEAEVMVQIESQIIPHQNWNAQWESDFEPVYVEDYVSILAPFHDKSTAKGMIVEIQPQMSFGTGHHQTTWMMSKAIFELSEMPKKVLDMGTGTGVLAIMAEKLGANKILAIDIEDWSAENAAENALRNGCTKITSLCGDIDLISGQQFGLILANINKNVLMAHLPHYANSLEVNGVLLLSGFFDSDVDDLLRMAVDLGFEKVKVLNKDNWAAIQLVKK